MALHGEGSVAKRLGVAGSHDEDSPKHLDAYSSPASTPITTTPDSTPFLSLADQSFTPLSLVDDSYDGDRSAVGEVGGGKPAAGMDQLPALERARLGAGSRGLGAREASDSAHQTSDVVPRVSKRASTGTDSEPCGEDRQRSHQKRRSCSQGRDTSSSNCARDAPSARSRSHQHETLGPVQGRRATRSDADTASSPKIALHGHDFGLEAHDTFCLPPLSSDFPPPLRTGSVQTDTILVQPRPNIVRTASDHGSLPLKHPTPDLNCRSGAYVGNVAQLEATAERLSLTSSIEDAIRDLHCELKRTESRRSTRLAARIRANSADDNTSCTPASSVGQLKRHLSNSSSIVSTNIAARHGGYSPAAYVMSPAHSLTGRLRSGSKTSTGRPEIDVNSLLSRHGPGKSSVRSIRSTKLSLAEISEMEPTTLTKDAFDTADSQPPIKNDNDDSPLPVELKDANMPTTDVFHQMMGNDDFWDNARSSSGIADPNGHLLPGDDEPQRPGSSGSTNTFQQAQNAFEDFDGVHWEPIPEDDPYAPPEEAELPTPRMPPPNMARPQSYMDPESGQQMLFYPARVPAMLNLPPKLSNKPRAADRNNRRSQVMSVMMDKRQSRMMERKNSIPENARDSWLPDPLAGHRDSFAALSSDKLNLPGETQSVHTSENVAHPEIEPVAEPAEPAEPLRRPQRLSRMDPEKRKSRMSNLPPQLRASAYFDIPDTNAPEVEVKDGSAMATLESILDASAHAPVSAFTDHNYAGKLGNEIYGKEKKRASMAPSTHLRTSSSSHLRTSSEDKEPKKRHSFMWLGKRHSHASDEKEHRRSVSDGDGLGPINAETRATEHEALAGSDDGSHVIRLDVDGVELIDEEEEEEDEEGESDTGSYQGPPTTLLAELQLRKQRQKLRTQNHFPNGMHSTLLEMDAVAETERKKRDNKRVNLAWEDANGNMAVEGSDDEDVPLAIIAARSQGAQNVMDLNRPIGLMERRELEENEPLSHRRARLAGLEPPRRLLQRPSNMNLSVNMESQPPLSPGEPLGLEDEEVEGETLADRKRRLAAKEEAENPLPKARPVSSVFSAELLSQFGDLDDKKEENAPPKAGEEETLGQRRRRLQAEREAREHEMSYNRLAGVPGPISRPMQMSQVLAAHPKKESDIRSQEQRRRIEEQNRLARERDAKMAAMRSQMPTTLIGPNLNRSGGFHSGQFNDGSGGQGLQAARSSPALNQVYSAGNYQNRASAVFSAYGAPVQQPYNGMGAMSNMGGYGGMNTLNPYGNGVYGGGMMQQGMQLPLNGGSMDRVEQWRQGVHP